MDKSVRVFKLRTQTEEALTAELGKLQTELSELRIAKIAGGTANKLGRIGVRQQSIRIKYLSLFLFIIFIALFTFRFHIICFTP